MYITAKFFLKSTLNSDYIEANNSLMVISKKMGSQNGIKETILVNF